MANVGSPFSYTTSPQSATGDGTTALPATGSPFDYTTSSDNQTRFSVNPPQSDQSSSGTPAKADDFWTRAITMPSGVEGADVPPELASGIIHGVREGILDKPAEWFARVFGGSDEAARVAAANKATADAARKAAGDNAGSFNIGNIGGRIAGQTAVLGPAARLVGAGLDAGGFALGLPQIGGLVTGAAGSTIPGAAGVLARTAAGATSGAAAGAGGGLLGLGDDPASGALWGIPFGAGGSVVAQGIERALRTLHGTYVPPDVRTPQGTWQASDQTVGRANQAQLLLDNGVPVQTQQVNRDPWLTPAAAPWTGQSGTIADQQQAFRKAALSRVIGTGDGSTPGGPSLATNQFIKDQTDRIGANFDGVASRTNIDFANDVAPGLTRLGMTPMDKNTRDALAPYLQDITNSVTRDPTTGAPIISGAKYLDLTQSSSPLQKLASSGGLPGKYAQDTIDLLHDGLAASATSKDQDLLRNSRAQYRALQAVKDARDPSSGSFEPAELSGAVARQSERYGSSTGIIDDLAHAANTVLQPSYSARGTAAGVGALAGLGTVPGVAGYFAGHALPGAAAGLGLLAIPAAGAGFGVPLMMQAMNRNPELVARAIRTLQGGANFAPYAAAPAVARTAALLPGAITGQP
jgi:hypothetical protein